MIKKMIIPALMVVVTVIACACGGDASNAESNDAKKVKPPVVALPEPPQVLQGRELASWMTAHFWEKMNPKDTAFKVYPEDLNKIVMGWAQIMIDANFGAMKAGVVEVLEKAKSDSIAVANLLNAMEKAFYDPNLQVRNFEAYIAAMEWAIGYEKFSEVDKIRANAQLEMLLKNRAGTKAINFNFMTLDNKKYKLYDVYGPFTLIFINNPGCPACKEYKDILSNDEVVQRMTGCAALQVIGIVPDDEEKAWRENANDFPKDWVNGFNYDMKMKKDHLYDLTVVPSLILLDKDKNVILKDVNPVMLIEFLKRL